MLAFLQTYYTANIRHLYEIITLMATIIIPAPRKDIKIVADNLNYNERKEGA
jgi:hypothetical protein